MYFVWLRHPSQSVTYVYDTYLEAVAVTEKVAMLCLNDKDNWQANFKMNKFTVCLDTCSPDMVGLAKGVVQHIVTLELAQDILSKANNKYADFEFSS